MPGMRGCVEKVRNLFVTRDSLPGANLTLLYRNVKWFRGGLVFEAHRLLYQSTLGLRVIKRESGRVWKWGVSCMDENGASNVRKVPAAPMQRPTAASRCFCMYSVTANCISAT